MGGRQGSASCGGWLASCGESGRVGDRNPREKGLVGKIEEEGGVRLFRVGVSCQFPRLVHLRQCFKQFVGEPLLSTHGRLLRNVWLCCCGACPHVQRGGYRWRFTWQQRLVCKRIRRVGRARKRPRCQSIFKNRNTATEFEDLQL